MQVDYRKRCVVRGETHDRVIYGYTATEYNAMSGFDDAADVEERFADLGVGGRQAGMIAEVGVTRYFYTPDMRDEQARDAQKGRIRR